MKIINMFTKVSRPKQKEREFSSLTFTDTSWSGSVAQSLQVAMFVFAR